MEKLVLTDAGLAARKSWEEKGYRLPSFDRQAMYRATKTAPRWLHFGAAVLQQHLLETGEEQSGIIVCENYDTEIIEKVYTPHDQLSVFVRLYPDGKKEKLIIASVAEALAADASHPDDWARLQEIFQAPSLQIASFTITEKGYRIMDGAGVLYPDVAEDFSAGPAMPQSFMGKLSALCYSRYLAGKYPLALVSMDNCSHNGEKLQAAILAFAKEWEKQGLVQEGFTAYLSDPGSVSFPWSMIDKITPRPDERIQKELQADGLETEILCTAKNTYVASYVNAEVPEYLVIEDQFPNGRPALEKSGVMFTTRETVEKTERMKVCTCLNPLHTALAIFGCLLGYHTIYEEMENPVLKALVEKIGYEEGMPCVVDPGIIRPADFLKEVLEQRLPNPFIPDTPQRIATDTSQKLSIRFGETIKASADARKLIYIPLVLAGWCRYLMGLDDAGQPFSISPDPMLSEVQAFVRGVALGQREGKRLAPLLSNAQIFGVDLHQYGLADLVIQMFDEMTAATGAVAATLKKYVG